MQYSWTGRSSPCSLIGACLLTLGSGSCGASKFYFSQGSPVACLRLWRAGIRYSKNWRTEHIYCRSRPVSLAYCPGVNLRAPPHLARSRILSGSVKLGFLGRVVFRSNLVDLPATQLSEVHVHQGYDLALLTRHVLRCSAARAQNDIFICHRDCIKVMNAVPGANPIARTL